MDLKELQELNTPQLAGVLGLSEQTIRNHVYAGRLAARRHGVRGYVRVTVDDLRSFAARYHYPLDEPLLARYLAEGRKHAVAKTHAPARA